MIVNQSHKYNFDHPEIWEGLRQHSLEKEISFIDTIFRDHKTSRILDVGCGSGIHCDGLTKLGYDVSGIDLNPKMVDYARSHYGSKFLIGDMRDLGSLNLSPKFDAILCLCTTFTYNLTNPEIIKTLKNFYNLLNKDGLLLLEFFNPISFLQKKKFEGSFFQEDPVYYEKLGLKIDTKHEVDEREQLLKETKRTFDLSGHLLSTDQTSYRLLFPQEIKFFLNQAGFEFLDQFGKYDLDYKSLDGTRLITLSARN